jgi:hypothetical protein
MQQQQPAAAAPASPTAASIHEMLLGNDFPERRKNYARNLVEGRIGSVAIVAEKAR